MQKTISVEGIVAPVVIARRKGTKSIRISIKSDGKVRLSVPYGATEGMAKRFLLSKKDWVNQHITSTEALLQDTRIGKSHRIFFKKSLTSSVRTSIKGSMISIPYTDDETIEHPDVQQRALKAAERALKTEAAQLLPQRLETLAQKHGIEYRSVAVKKLKSRWGSCDNRKNIILNIYLMQLDWHLIDYVLLHELAHTYHQHHQASFWEYLESICPNAKDLRKELKPHPTSVVPTAL